MFIAANPSINYFYLWRCPHFPTWA